MWVLARQGKAKGAIEGCSQGEEWVGALAGSAIGRDKGGDGVQVDGRRGDRALPKGRWEMVRAKRSKTPWEV